MNVTLSGSSSAPEHAPRRAKIVGTLGPASNNETTFRALVRAGLDVARLNFSHGTHPEKLKLIEMVRKICGGGRQDICILGDLQGPKIRTGRLEGPEAGAAGSRDRGLRLLRAMFRAPRAVSHYFHDSGRKS